MCLDKSIRNIVFAHIEYQLSLPKYFLLRKAKQLRIKQEKTKTKKAFTKLKKGVLEVMPSVLLQYEGNYKRIDEIRFVFIFHFDDTFFKNFLLICNLLLIIDHLYRQEN